MLVGVDVDELQHALGGIVLEAAYLERVLRTVFSALVGSKYAAVVDGRLTAAALIEDCERITRYHTAIAQAEPGVSRHHGDGTHAGRGAPASRSTG